MHTFFNTIVLYYIIIKELGNMKNYKKYAAIADNGKIIAYGIFYNLNQYKWLESKSPSFEKFIRLPAKEAYKLLNKSVFFIDYREGYNLYDFI